ncbi:hypothetical protein RRG08_033772 [Elysia crispata]|uniref:Uncharacterized protein n=1 Tax=Elysia crispata TaxID=231223 RepID=A0AAE1AS18_9GAST|nr:hypothetical protein RRG08_033772 [Elysia crispata]
MIDILGRNRSIRTAPRLFSRVYTVVVFGQLPSCFPVFIQSWYSNSSQAAFPCLYSRGIRTAPKLFSRVYTVVVFGQLPGCFPVFIQSWYSDSSQAASPCLYSRGIPQSHCSPGPLSTCRNSLF